MMELFVDFFASCLWYFVLMESHKENMIAARLSIVFSDYETVTISQHQMFHQYNIVIF